MLLKKLGAVLVATVLTSPGITYGAVGEGGLPEGADSYPKLLKYKNEWEKLSSTVKARGDEMKQDETLAIKLFLKQLANEYNDIERLSKGILDPQKSDRGIAIGKQFRKLIRECDDAVSKGDLNKIIENYPVSNKLLTEFIELLQDVPDEL